MTHRTGLAILARFAKQAVVTPLAKGMERRRAVQVLRQLPDHLLTDIGLSRADIPAAVYGPGERSTAVAAAWRGLVALFRLARERRATIRTLNAMPDHLLADIGIERGNIDLAVDTLIARMAARPEAVVSRAATPLEALAAALRRALRPLAQWNISRQAAGEMARIDGKLMTDIGYVKGDVDWVPEVLTARRLTAANDSGAHPRAA